MKEVKEALKFKYLQKDLIGIDGLPVIDEETGECFQTVQDTSELSTIGMNDFNEKIRMFALEKFNIVLPLPNEQGALKFDEHGNINN